MLNTQYVRLGSLFPSSVPDLQRLDRNDVEHHLEVTVIFMVDASR